ncbi:TPA: hypothetical protein SIA39_003991 [Aeromonas sobria]|nr:hypothetical protein [Aeromonas sobria]
MRTFKLTKKVKAELQTQTVYAVRDPSALFRYFGKDNCTEIRKESAYLAALRKHTTLVPVLYRVQGAHVIDDLSAVFIRGLCACFEGNTLFVYDMDSNAYVNEVIEVEAQMYIVMSALAGSVQAVEMKRNTYNKTELLKLLRDLRNADVETTNISEYKVLGHFLQQKHWR